MNKKTFYQIVRFLLIGGIATLIDYSIFYLFNLVILKSINKSLNIFLSTALGFSAGLIFNWIFSKFVFQLKNKQTKKQFIIYIIVCLLGLGITELGMILSSPLFNKLFLKIFIQFDFWKLFFKCLMTIIVLIFNFFARKYIVFKDDEEIKSEIKAKQNI